MPFSYGGKSTKYALKIVDIDFFLCDFYMDGYFEE